MKEVGGGHVNNSAYVWAQRSAYVWVQRSAYVNMWYTGRHVSIVIPKYHHGTIVIIDSLFQSSIWLPCQSNR